MSYTHTPENRHAQVILRKFGIKITISSENVADGLAMGIRMAFARVMTQSDWDKVVTFLDGVFLGYQRS